MSAIFPEDDSKEGNIFQRAIAERAVFLQWAIAERAVFLQRTIAN